MSAILVRENWENIPVMQNETARYLGYSQKDLINGHLDKRILSVINTVETEMHEKLLCNAVFDDYKKIELKNDLKIADFLIKSTSLFENLKNCSRVVLIAATIGPRVDALIRRSQLSDSVYAAVMQASGAMFIESFVDVINNKLKKKWKQKGYKCHPRFSPGYGDLELSVQKEIFRILPCDKIGLTLMDTLIMAPEKSVTAFIGLSKETL